MDAAVIQYPCPRGLSVWTGRLAVAATLFAPLTGNACDVALLLAVDVSGSIDRGEFRLQVDGLADALRDPEVSDALVLGQIALAVVQWSGSGQQTITLPWRRMLDPSAVAEFADRAGTQQRAYSGSDTAVGEAIAYSVQQFGAVSDCRRKVIDISGDGPQNAGFPLAPERSGAERAGIEINAIAIEDIGSSYPITAFYERLVITDDGFAMTARGLEDYPRAIRAKILREIAKPIG
jgi:Ca-activated chloride channel family protein